MEILEYIKIDCKKKIRKRNLLIVSYLYLSLYILLELNSVRIDSIDIFLLKIFNFIIWYSL